MGPVEKLSTLRPRSPRWPGGAEGLSPPEQDLPLEGPRRSPWEGLALGAPYLHSPPSRPPPEGGAERPRGAVDPGVQSVPRPAPPGPPAADGRRPAGSCREGRDGSRDTCEVGSFGSSSLPDLGSSHSQCIFIFYALLNFQIFGNLSYIFPLLSPSLIAICSANIFDIISILLNFIISVLWPRI